MTGETKSKSRRWLILFLIGLVGGAAGVYLLLAYRNETGPFVKNTVRRNSPGRERWARPIQVQGVPNCHKVSDALYRGAQPDAEGMKGLKALGVRTIVNLRSFHDDEDESEGTGLALERIKCQAMSPKDEQVVRFLQIVTDPQKQPVFVHCQHGSDRTGTMCAIYRIAVQGWSKADALSEMTKGGFGFHAIWENLEDYIHELDVDAIKKQAGLE